MATMQTFLGTRGLDSRAMVSPRLLRVITVTQFRACGGCQNVLNRSRGTTTHPMKEVKVCILTHLGEADPLVGPVGKIVVV